MRDDTAAAPTYGAAADCEPASMASDLVAQMFDDQWGSVSPSCYDMAHIARAWARRPDLIPTQFGVTAVEALIQRQNVDGSWGNAVIPGDFRLADNLSAIAALLTVASCRDRGRMRADINPALRRGLDRLATDVGRYRMDTLPDMIGWKYLVPALVEEIDAVLAGYSEHILHHLSSADVGALRGRLIGALELQRGWRDSLAGVRAAAKAGRRLPAHTDHLWELFDGIPAPPRCRGSVGCSPSATVAWLASSVDDPPPESLDYLQVVMDRGVPTVLPIDICERAWALMALLNGGLSFAGPIRDDAITWMRKSLGARGAAMTDGWVPDADDTAAIVFLLNRLGAPTTPAMLLDFQTDEAFTAFTESAYSASSPPAIGARTLSVSVNAHVLDAFGSYLEHHPDERRIFGGPAEKARNFILASQTCDGSWPYDKWHSSPLYATSCAVLALDRYSHAPAAVDRALAWIIDTQRADGSWGQRCPTLEETAHALLALCCRAHDDNHSVTTAAISRGARFLDGASQTDLDDSSRIPLWIGKTLHHTRSHHAYVIAARHAARQALHRPGWSRPSSKEPV